MPGGRDLPLRLASPTGLAFALLAALPRQEIVGNATRLAREFGANFEEVFQFRPRPTVCWSA